jgi:hypothetical protein
MIESSKRGAGPAWKRSDWQHPRRPAARVRETSATAIELSSGEELRPGRIPALQAPDADLDLKQGRRRDKHRVSVRCGEPRRDPFREAGRTPGLRYDIRREEKSRQVDVAEGFDRTLRQVELDVLRTRLGQSFEDAGRFADETSILQNFRTVSPAANLPVSLSRKLTIIACETSPLYEFRKEITLTWPLVKIGRAARAHRPQTKRAAEAALSVLLSKGP